MSWSENTRSKHALAVDRGLQAKKQHKTFNKQYESSQNRSDVEGWDDKRKIRDTPKPPKDHKPKPEPTPEPPKEKPKKPEYTPKGKEKESLRRTFFSKMNPVEQFKDLQTTRNVVRTEKQLKAWKKNPKNGDVRGVDTQPPGFVGNRLKAVASYTGAVVMDDSAKARNKFQEETGMRIGRVGGQTMGFHAGRGTGYIFIRQKKIPKSRTAEKVLAHELGHQVDYVAGGRSPLRRTGNIQLTFNKFDSNIMKKNEAMVKRTRRFNAYFGTVPYASDTERSLPLLKKGFKKGEGYDKFLGYSWTKSDLRYRFKQEEQFAEFFSAFATNPKATKKYNPQAYNIFKKGAGKGVFKAMRRADFDFLKPHLGGRKAKGFKIF